MQTADTPLVSVITTTYNRADRLKDMIQSVINQTYTNWELILVDERSTHPLPQAKEKLPYL